MATITIGGKQITVAPFKFRETKAAAPYIDRVLAERRNRQGDETAEQMAARMLNEEEGVLTRMTNSLGDTLSVLAIGILKDEGNYPYTTAKISNRVEELEAELSFEEISLIGNVFDAVLREAGMVRAAVSPTMSGGKNSPSPSGSTDSLPSSSQPGAQAETGTE